MTVGRFAKQPLAERRPTAQWRHVGLGPSLIEEHQTGWINPPLILAPLRAAPRHVGTILLAGVQRFF